MRLSRSSAALLAALVLPLFGVAAMAQGTAPVTPAAKPTLPPAASPAVPARVGTPVAPAATPAAPTATTAALTGRKIDVNGASEADLASLPGIGPVTAKAIVDGRPWDDLAELSKKKVINQPTYERNKDRLALANINMSSAADMAKALPGIGDKTAPKIVAARPYATPHDLVAKKVLTEGQFAKIKDVIAY